MTRRLEWGTVPVHNAQMGRRGKSTGGDGLILQAGDIERAGSVHRPGPRAVGTAARSDSALAFEGLKGGAAGGRHRVGGLLGRNDPGQPWLMERREVAPGLVRFRVERPVGLEFRAGQYVKFGLPGNQRSYTVASAPGEDALEFFIELIPGGRLSEPLRSVRPGTQMAVGPRGKGSFLLDERASHHLFVATVTGVAPFVSIVRNQFREAHDAPQRARQQRFVLLHGASHADEFGYADELSELAARHPDRLSYLPTVSRPDARRNAGWTGAVGRVDTHVRPTLARLGLPPSDTAVYACGNSGMIRNVRLFASAAGLRFHSEAFD